MHGLAEACDLLHFEFDIRIDHAVSEHTTFGQERTVFIQILQGLVLAVAHGGYQCVFLGWQVVEVFGSGFAGVNFVFDTVQTSHQQS